jgi:predicted RNase H-like nuclease
MSEVVIGVDGCRGGWITVVWKGHDHAVRFFRNFAELLNAKQELNAAIIAVDMPIGLPKLHGRTAEREARLALGARSSSVFSTPSSAAFAARDWDKACKINLANSDPQRKLSKQSYGLFKKINEIDKILADGADPKVQEVHPELSFYQMNGRQPLTYPKKRKEGEEERLHLLRGNGFASLDLEIEQRPFKRADVGRDDIIDAFACAWSARRIHLGTASSYPAHEERDEHGLIMRIMA